MAIINKMSMVMMMKGAATNTDGNDGGNEVKLRAASRGGCKQQNWQSSEQDAAVQRNHRVEGFLCDSESRAKHTHASIKRKIVVSKLYRLQSSDCTITLL